MFIEYHKELFERGLKIRGGDVVNINEFEIGSKEWGDAIVNKYRQREYFTEKYSWAVPTEEAIREIAKYAPILEIGAGAGYWAYLLRKIGVEILAFDEAPPGGKKENSYRHKRQWSEVLEGNIEKVDEYPNHTLFLCWPPYDDPMAFDCITRTKAKHLIYVGEGGYGCNATDEFFAYVHKHFDECETDILIPKWDGIHDYFEIYKRKER